MKNPILGTIPREELYFYKVILNYLFLCIFYLRSAVTYYIFRKRYFYKLQNAIPYLFKYICIYKRLVFTKLFSCSVFGVIHFTFIVFSFCSGCHLNLVNRYGISVSLWLCSTCRNRFSVFPHS